MSLVTKTYSGTSSTYSGVVTLAALLSSNTGVKNLTLDATPGIVIGLYAWCSDGGYRLIDMEQIGVPQAGPATTETNWHCTRSEQIFLNVAPWYLDYAQGFWTITLIGETV